MDAPSDAARLIDLETRYTHLERQFDELSAVVARQQTTLDGLVKRLNATLTRVDELGPAQANDRPPHY